MTVQRPRRFRGESLAGLAFAGLLMLAVSACRDRQAPDTGPGPSSERAADADAKVEPAEEVPSESIGMTMMPEPKPPGVDLLALERQPGLTPPLEQVTLAAPPPYAGLPGAPGPSPAMGSDTAPVKVVVFSDFQCPVCGRAVEPLKHLVREYEGKVQVVFKHNALSIHAHAADAAAASIAALRQGKFWDYHDRLFQNQGALQVPDLIRYAGDLGLDTERFEKDMNDPSAAAQVAYESEMATRLDARGTPAFFINGDKQLGWGSYPGFKGMVENALQKAQPFQKEGQAPEKVARLATAASGQEGKLLADLLWGPDAPR